MDQLLVNHIFYIFPAHHWTDFSPSDNVLVLLLLSRTLANCEYLEISKYSSHRTNRKSNLNVTKGNQNKITKNKVSSITHVVRLLRYL